MIGEGVQDFWDAVRHPQTTLEGIGNILGGYACQLLGVESDMRLSSEAATDYISSRYGTYGDFKKGLAADPVGVAADFSLLLTASPFAVPNPDGSGRETANGLLRNAEAASADQAR